jgi:hypothetical protein
MNKVKTVDIPPYEQPKSFWSRGIYKTGDGDVVSAKRPGSEDYKKYKSLTTGGVQAQYNQRGHK